MQACQVCGTTAVDAAGYCTGCRLYRGTQSYALSPPAADLPAAGLPAAGLAAAPQSDPGAVYYATSSYAHQSNVAAYPDSPHAAAYPYAPHPVGEPAPAQPTRSPLTTPLFLLTVMVVVLVAGTVSVVLIRSKDRGAQPGGNAGQTAPPAAAAEAAPSGQPSATPDTSATVDRCVVGEWAITSFRVKTSAVDLSTEAGGIFTLRAEGTGTWDFGSGITLTGTVEGIKSEDLVTGRVEFGFRTAGQSFSFQDVRSDVREVLDRAGEDPVNRQIPIDLSVAEYTCAGDAFRLKIGGYDLQMGRR
jgi:hypothetical protein